MGVAVRTDHIAFVTGDTEATVDFYTRVMRWPLVGTHRGTEPDGRKFFMTAFRADGYCIEFEEVEGRAAPPTVVTGFPHLGIDVGTFADYDRWKAHLEDCGVDYVEMMRGDVFVTDPNGVGFQLFVKQTGESESTDADRAERAEQMVNEWIEERRITTF